VISYLIGSVPTAFLVARLRGINIFEVGSGNMGATNVLRVMGLGWGLFVWFFDSFKGVLAIFIGLLLLPENTALATVVAAFAAIIGHNWSLFAKLLTGTLRGGKGAATAFGTFLVIVPIYVWAVMLILGGIVIALTRYMSLAVLMMFSLAAIWMVILLNQQTVPVEFTIYTILIVVMIFYRFRENIQRLLTGTERRMFDRGVQT
jgi:acyl phosphate:glycerol-3-phosphate acyltransferase